MTKTKNITDEVIDLLLKELDFFHTDEPQAFAIIKSDDIREVLKIPSEAFGSQVRLIASNRLGVYVKMGPLREIVDYVKSYAILSAPNRKLHVRYSNSRGSVYVDLGSKSGEVVKITSHGFKILKKHKARFFRPPGQKALTLPVKGGGYKELKKLFPNINLDDFKLVLSWMIYVIHSKGPFPILVFQGEQGSAKTFFMRMIRDLLDPMTASLISFPSSEKNMIIAAQNNVVLAFDNISSLPKGSHDWLCRLSTGGGLRNRALFTDGDEKVFEALRPVMLNGITNFILKSDLADRVMLINLKTINENTRRPGAEVWEDYLELKASVLWDLYNSVSVGLQNINTISDVNFPRMADFGKFACATAPSLNWKKEDFLACFNDNRKALSGIVFSSDKVVESISVFVKTEGGWEGSATELLNELESDQDNTELMKKRYWPGSAAVLGSKVMQCAPLLRNLGIEHAIKRKNSARIHKFWLI